VHTLCEKIARRKNLAPDYFKKLITFVKDRPGHDRRYAIDCSKIKQTLGWRQTVDFNQGLDLTIDWYLGHGDWVETIRSGAYQQWLDLNYGKRAGN
jgi:dTDP-glucose 4,6-dehydratase